MEKNNKLSRLMKMSWEIQRRKRITRSKSLESAWAIINNEDITIFYLLKRHNTRREIKPQTVEQIGLFAH